MRREELAAALYEHAYLEGDFVLRSGRRSSYYLDKYRFETRPDLLAVLGDYIAAAVAEHEVALEQRVLAQLLPELPMVHSAPWASASRRSASGAARSTVTIEPSS